MLLTDVRWLFTLLIVFSFATTSCRSSEPVSTSKPTATVVPFPTFTATPVEVHAELQVSLPTPVAADEPSLLLGEGEQLPASLYYLSTDGQIWFLDHMTLQHRQLTTESSPIGEFDVGPNHGRLVYVTDNQLVEFDPQTGARVIKVSGPTVPPAQADGKHTIEDTIKEIGALFLGSPHYSPDGSLIAYSHAGINLIDSGGSEAATPQRLLTNTLYFEGQLPTDSAVNWSRNVAELHTYSVSSWSPDNKKLLLSSSATGWGGSEYEIYDRATTTLSYVETNKQEPFAHGSPILGEWQWSSDSSYGIMANSAYGMPYESGLFYVDAGSGVGHKLDLTSLIATVEESPFHPVARTASEHASGIIRFWMGTRILVAEQRIFYALAEIDLTTNAVSWIQDAEERSEFELGEVLWATDGSGLINSRSPLPLQWLPTDGSEAVDLGVSGTHLRWKPTVVEEKAAKAEVPRQTNPLISPPTPPLLAWAMAPDGAIYVLDSWMVLYELAPDTLSPVARSERLRSAVSGEPAVMAVDAERIYLAGIQLDGIQLLRRQDFSMERRLEFDPINSGYGYPPFQQIAIDPGRKLFIIGNGVLWAYDLSDLTAPPSEVHRRGPVSPASIPVEIRVDEKMRRLYLVVDAGLSGSGRGRKLIVYDLDSLTSIGWFSPDWPITSLPSIATMADKMVFTLDSLGGDGILQIFSRSALFQNVTDEVPPLAQTALGGKAIIDPTGEWIYLVDRRWLWVLRSSDLGLVSLIPLLNTEPTDLLISPDGESVYLIRQSGITVLNTNKLQTVGIVPVAPFPQGWIADNNASQLFLSPQVEEDGIAFRSLGDTLFRSEDGGQSWTPLIDYQARNGQSAESLQVAWSRKYSLSPTFAQDRTLLAHSGTIYRSTNAGESWEAWTPQLAFTSDRSGNRDIFTADAQGQKLQQITAHPASDETPAWSPAWTRIAFASDRSGNWDIYSIRADCAPQSAADEEACDLRQLTTDPADDLLPAWSPDGRLIAFVSLRDGNAEIYVMNSDGSEPLRITNDPGGDWRPVWLPNAHSVAFTSDRAGSNDIYRQLVRQWDTLNRIPVDTSVYNNPSPWIQTAADERDLAIDTNGNLIYWTNGINRNGSIASRFAGDRSGKIKHYLTDLGNVGHPSAGIGEERWYSGVTVSIERADDVDIYYLDEEKAILLIDGPGFDGHPASGPVWWDPAFVWE